MNKWNLKVVNMNNLAYKAIGLYQDNEEKPIYFQTRFGIQTFFLKHSTLCLVLRQLKGDEPNYEIIKQKLVKKNSFFFWDLKYKDIVEIPMIHSKVDRYKIGDHIKLSFE